MADREKLIEICRRYDGTPPCETCETPIGNCSMCGLERLIDYLIANGVTVRERGRWEIYDDGYGCELMYCPICKSEFYDGDNDTIDQLHNFCPNCGADMRGEEDGK